MYKNEWEQLGYSVKEHCCAPIDPSVMLLVQHNLLPNIPAITRDDNPGWMDFVCRAQCLVILLDGINSPCESGHAYPGSDV